MKTRRSDMPREEFSQLLWRSRLLTPEEAEELERRWRQDTADPADLSAFTHWLVLHQFATDFQILMLLHGHADYLFLGPYKLLERIGRGSLATVYKGVHRLGQLAALKVLPPSRASDRVALVRFEREGRLARSLDHPNVVRTLESGQDHNLHYLVMEYLAGDTLEQVLRQRGRLDVAEAVAIISQALLGLQHLHERGLVHRNLEPANLMLVRAADRPDQVLVKVLDISFSHTVAEPTTAQGGPNPRPTYEGLELGPAGYLAPEQARDAHSADIRADIYSLGCILYQCLAGQPPFPDAKPLRQMIRHATESPRPLCEVNPEVPEGLQLVVNWMMARDPAQRYPTPQRALGALLTVQEGQRGALLEPPTSEADPGSPGQAPPEPREVFAPLDSPNQAGAADAGALRAQSALAIESTLSRAPTRRLGRRNLGWLVIGALGLLAAQALGWFLGRLWCDKSSSGRQP
jgi:serine/threonine protein kinase